MKTLAKRLQVALNRLAAMYPEADLRLNTGCSDEDLADLEHIVGANLPDAFKVLYRVCDGQAEDGDDLLNGEEWLSLERITEEWQNWQSQYDKGLFIENGLAKAGIPTDDGVRALWWSPLWLPFTCDGAGNHACVDLNPSSSGRYGQIIRVWRDDASRNLEATSLDEWIEAYVEGLEEGDYVYDAEFNCVIDASEVDDDDDDDGEEYAEHEPIPEGLWSEDEAGLHQRFQQLEADIARNLTLTANNDAAIFEQLMALLNQTQRARVSDMEKWQQIQDLFQQFAARNLVDDGDEDVPLLHKPPVYKQ